MMDKLPIVGRYAPSPTGAQHLGNLRTALLAWLHARLQDGRFLVRMEDLDTPRTVAGSAAQILRDLEWLGIDWDGDVVYQSQRQQLYQDALDSLDRLDMLFPCFCSRKDIAAASSAPHHAHGVYPGTCAALSPTVVALKQQHKAPAIRLRVSPALQTSCGDFVVKRADQLFAYQLAVVVDDLEQQVTHVVRGEDLADSVARQQYLAALLAPTTMPICYLHTPLMCDAQGQRMAKRDGSDSLAQWRLGDGTAEQLVAALIQGLALVDHTEPISAQDLVRSTSLERLLEVLNAAH